MKLHPLYDKVIIEPIEDKTNIPGLIIPDAYKEPPQRGKVIAVGSGTKEEPTTVKVNDVVLYSRFSGDKIKIENKDFLIMKERDILSIIIG